MGKDQKYYKQVVAKFFADYLAENKKTAYTDNAECVIVDTDDDSCSIVGLNAAISPRYLLFFCHLDEEGKEHVIFVSDGKDKVAEMLGLVDLYDKNERVEVPYVRKEDGFLHLDLPDELKKYSNDFFKTKLYDLDGFVGECNYTGWGDCFTCNVLEVIADLMNQECVDFEKNEIVRQLNSYVGPAETEGSAYYAVFEFSHCEIANDSDDETGWAVYVCYKYYGLQEYGEDE